MAIVFTDWETWTNDQGITPYALDWSADDAMNGFPPAIPIEALRQALLERQLVSGGSWYMPSEPDSTPAWTNEVLGAGYWTLSMLGGNDMWRRLIMHIDEHAWGIATTHFVNHEDSGGSWDGTPAVTAAPLWTESSLLSSLGDAERIKAPLISSLGIFGGDTWLDNCGSQLGTWARQIQRVLNRCLWVRDKAHIATQSYHASPGALGGADWDGTSWASWADARASWGYMGYGNSQTYSLTRAIGGGQPYRVNRTVADYVMDINPYQQDVDVYALVTDGGYDLFYDEFGLGGQYASLWQTHAAVANLTGVDAIVLGRYIDPATAGVPTWEPASGDQGWEIELTMVSKYNVSGGFFTFLP